MKVKIHSVKFDADKELHSFVTERVDKLELFYDKIVAGEVFLRIDGTSKTDDKVAEIRLTIPGKELFAKKNGKWGVINFDNKTLVPPMYDSIHFLGHWNRPKTKLWVNPSAVIFGKSPAGKSGKTKCERPASTSKRPSEPIARDTSAPSGNLRAMS